MGSADGSVRSPYTPDGPRESFDGAKAGGGNEKGSCKNGEGLPSVSAEVSSAQDLGRVLGRAWWHSGRGGGFLGRLSRWRGVEVTGATETPLSIPARVGDRGDRGGAGAMIPPRRRRRYLPSLHGHTCLSGGDGGRARHGLSRREDKDTLGAFDASTSGQRKFISCLANVGKARGLLSPGIYSTYV